MKTFTIDHKGFKSKCEAETFEEALNIFMRRSKDSVEIYNLLRQMLAKHIKEVKQCTTPK